MSAMKTLLAVAALAVLSGGAPAAPVPELDAAPAHDGLFRVGTTGILCYQEPCPRRGIVPVDAEDPGRWRPIWSGAKPPALQGSAGDQRHIAAAWADGGCLIVGGFFVEETLHVRQIHGDC